jgi:ABC-type glycerol-3-phosphate transport system permease component
MRGIGIHIFLAIGAVLTAFPLYIVIVTAFKSNAEVFQNPIGLPLQPTFDNFVTSWTTADFGRLFLNSTLLTGVSMAIATFLCSLAGYAIARRSTRGSAAVYLFLAAGIFLPLQLALIPQFRMIRDLGLIDSFAGVILVYVASALPFGCFLMAAFMRAVPPELAEAATIDGAGYFGIYARVYLPLSAPAIGTFFVLQGVGIWNDYLVPLTLLSDPDKRTLTTGILVFKQQYLAQWGNIMAGVIIMAIPILIVFALAQRSFVQGLHMGSIK